ncbi:MAG: adenylate/guanylate cyclase domain-containing protein [bacterium]
MRCPQCSFDNPAGTRFCGQCGTRLGTPCPSCGTLNPEGFAFCGTCGASLTSVAVPTSTAEERKVVTILFADVTGSTAIAERLDPEQMRAVMGRFFQAMTEVIGRYEGTVEKFIGDEVMAVFGLPITHEDDPERAVRAAAAMRERLDELNRELEAARGIALQMRIGINTGEVVADPRATEKGEFMVTGDAVNVAARLRGAADPGGTVVGERTYWNTAPVVEYRVLSPLSLKGKALPVKAWEFLRLLPEATRRGPGNLRAPMIGREEEVALLNGVIHRVIREGRPYLVTILGEPGVGKTRLFQEISALLPPTVAVRQGRSLPYGSTALWAVGEIIRADCGVLRSDPLALMTEKVQQRVADLWGEERESGEARQITAHLARILGIRGLAADPTPEGSREDLFWALRRYFERLAGRAPLILAFEDLHWGDGELLDLIEYVAQWTTGVPLLVLSLTRPQLLEVRPAWGGGKRNYTSLFLDPLTKEHSDRLLQELLQTREVPDAVGSAVTVAEGNPFFVEEILRMLIDAGALRRRDGGWESSGSFVQSVPDTIHGVITARLDRLSREEKSALQEASILGTRFWVGGLVHVTGESEAALLPVLTALAGKDFLAEQGRSQLEGQREFAFKNLVIRDVAYAMLPKSRRSEKHQRFGVWLEQTYGERTEEFADLLAHHWGQAAHLAREIGLAEQWKEVAPKALRYALMAGRRAAGVYANEQALTHFEAVRALAEELGADTERIAAIEGLADVYALQAQWDEASHLYQEALTFHQQQGDAVRQARVQSRIGSTFSGVFDFRQALPHIRSAANALEAERAEQDLVPIYIQMARTQTYLGNFAPAQEFAQTAQSLAQKHSLREQEVEARLFLAWTDVMLARPGIVARMTELVEEEERLKGPIRMTAAYQGKSFLHYVRGEWAPATEASARALAAATDTGNRARIASVNGFQGLIHFRTGDWPAARVSFQRYLGLSAAFPIWEDAAKSFLAFIDGDAEASLGWANHAVRRAESMGNMPLLGDMVDWSGFLHLRLGRLGEGQRLLAHWLGEFRRMGIFWPAYLHPLAAETALGLGDLPAARQHWTQAEELSWMDLAPARARLLRARGLVKAAERFWEEAVALIGQATELYETIGQPYDRARCLEALADVYGRQGGRENQSRAAATLREAAAIYQQLGANFEVSRIEQVSSSD